MLPFLNKRKNVTMMVKEAPGILAGPEESMSYSDDLLDCARELIAAVEAKDAKAVASALEAAFYACDLNSSSVESAEPGEE
jgi:hypothetical protein